MAVVLNGGGAKWWWCSMVAAVEVMVVRPVLEFGCLILSLWLSDAFRAEDEKSQGGGFVSKLPGWRPMLLPLQILLKPFQKRFVFHFYGSKKTNNLDKVKKSLIKFRSCSISCHIQIIQKMLSLRFKWRSSNQTDEELRSTKVGLSILKMNSKNVLLLCWFQSF